MENNGALVKAEQYDGLVMHCSPAEAQRRVQELQAFVKANMKNGIDFGVIPGTGGKPTLYQPGAQKLCELYGLAHDFLDMEAVQDWDKGFFLYRKRCVITDRRNGSFVGAGVGSCNSREDRYAWRWLWPNQLPKGFSKDGAKQRSTKSGDVQYRVPNEDIYSLVNTIEKMACKRALIHAVISVTRSSGMFTQDVEDLPAEAFGEVEQSRQWEKVIDAEVVEVKPADKSAELAVEWTKKIAATKTQAECKALLSQIGALPESVKGLLKKPYSEHMKKLRAEPAPQTTTEDYDARQPGEEG